MYSPIVVIEVTAKNATGRPALVAEQRRDRDDEREDDHEQHRPGRRPVLVQASPQTVAWYGTVTGEREHHARGGRNAAHPAEQLADRRDVEDEFRQPGAERRLDHRNGAAAALVDRGDVRRRERDREQQRPAADRRVRDGLSTALAGRSARRRGSPLKDGPRRRSR